MSGRVYVTGNPGIDSLNYIVSEMDKPSHHGRPYVVVTTHRRENREALTDIIEAVNESAKRFPGVDFIWPVHLNPEVSDAVYNSELRDNIKRVPAMGYVEFVRLLWGCEFVVTDSGGIQEECTALLKPCLVMRDTTERPEGVEAGSVGLMGTDPETIRSAINIGLKNTLTVPESARTTFGDGQAAGRILKVCKELAV